MNTSQRCGCSKHFELTKDKSYTVKKIEHRPYRKCIIEALVGNGVLSSKAKYLCTVCAGHANEIGEASSAKKGKFLDLNEIVIEIENGGFDETDLVKISSALGKSQKGAFVSEAQQFTTTYKSNLSSFEPFVHERNPVLYEFLKSLVGIETVTTNFQSIALIAAMDCLLAASNKCVITPLFFALNLLIYFISGSKTIIQLLSSLSPAGCYTSVLNWFKDKTAHKVICPNENDIITYFDNNQVLVRNWRVRYNAKAIVSVITSVVHIQQYIHTQYQYVRELDPFSWLYNTNTNNRQVIEKIQDKISASNSKFDALRNAFILQRLNKVYMEHKTGTLDFIDEILGDPNIKVPHNSSCNHDPYSNIEHSHPENPPTIIVGDPCFENPCSYDSVDKVLKHLLSNTVDTTDREWTVIGCDGLPYLLAARLIEKDPTLQHILLQPGLGHFEINMTKACFRLLWEVALSDLGKMLGYNSIKAQIACKNANDHHKAWQMLTIFFEGTADELVVPYVRHCISQSVRPTLNDFYVWLNTVSDPNYTFMKDVVFTYTFALFLFRSAVRRNNSEIMIAARNKFAPLFYGLNMTCYQEIDYRDLKVRVLAPDQLQQYLAANESFSVTGHPSKGEGGDFILENKNRRIKMIIPSGLPSRDRWLRVCRSFDSLDKIRSNMQKWLQVPDEDTNYMHHANLSEEICQWRMRLRTVQYLLTPMECKDHLSVSSQVLDKDLVLFSQHCKGNRELYLCDIADGRSPGKGDKLQPVFITKGDREKFQSITSKTKEQIKSLILREITQIREIGAAEEADRLFNYWDKKVKTQTKDNFIMFYKTEVCAVLDDVVNNHPLLGPDAADENLDC